LACLKVECSGEDAFQPVNRRILGCDPVPVTARTHKVPGGREQSDAKEDRLDPRPQVTDQAADHLSSVAQSPIARYS
jgi:hypothetical protein